jgi:hypothetical protein
MGLVDKINGLVGQAAEMARPLLKQAAEKSGPLLKQTTGAVPAGAGRAAAPRNPYFPQAGYAPPVVNKHRKWSPGRQLIARARS